MTDDLVVVADGVEQADPRDRKRQSPQVIVALVAFALGLGLGVIVVSPPSETTADETPELAAPIVEPVLRATDSGLGELVAGLTDSLVVVAEGGSGGFERLIWPAKQALTEANAGSGDVIDIDRSGQLLATTQSVPGLEGSILTMGRISTMTPVAAGVTSFRWHDAKSGQLSYTVESDGQWSLWRIFPDNQTVQVADISLGPGQVAAWGDWGWAIQRPDSEVALLTPQGALKAVRPGTALASHGSGWILVANERLELVSAGGGVVNLDVSVDRVGDINTATFSPDGEAVAIAGERGVLVFPVLGEGLISEIASSSPTSVAWSTDSRFIVLASRRGVSIFDLDTVGNQTVLTTSTVLAVRMIAGTS